MKLLICAILVLLPLSSKVSAEEYFGEFKKEPQFEVISEEDGRPKFRLLEDFVFTDPNGLEWTTPKGWEVDGATIPKLAWSLVGGPMSGRYLHASIIHDRYCDTESRTTHDTHRNFYYGMRAKGVDERKAKLMYTAVRLFGPSWKIEKKRVFRLSPGGDKNSQFRIEKTSSPSLDITDEQLNVALDQINLDRSLDDIDGQLDETRAKMGLDVIQRNFPE